MRYQWRLQVNGVAATMIDAIRWTHNTPFILRTSNSAAFVATISTACMRIEEKKENSLDGQPLGTFMRN